MSDTHDLPRLTSLLVLGWVIVAVGLVAGAGFLLVTGNASAMTWMLAPIACGIIVLAVRTAARAVVRSLRTA
ncbi:hypothetical protein [Schumannella sp. 10F1B-5-1]|uniref:hypothetical protein n=1 Tax=Schumannella sp. 10F1B-5-1 TaxID=2590780 RepID=UPI0011317563|nr:hypothetical protein [Schumannella sp. 10F1B-5-1]TPW76707.1 hypothetical protein FJ658_01835 [Schumannella sp. 10F1B-5-1]